MKYLVFQQHDHSNFEWLAISSALKQNRPAYAVKRIDWNNPLKHDYITYEIKSIEFKYAKDMSYMTVVIGYEENGRACAINWEVVADYLHWLTRKELHTDSFVCRFCDLLPWTQKEDFDNETTK